MRGLDFALNDICLAAFTTLAPGATLAYVVLACTLLFGKLDSRLRQRIESWLIVPLAVATVGLVASATHLGTPSNALYVFRTVGSSPLATEVFSAVLFLGTSCSYWLGCIYIEGHKALRSLWLLASIAAAVLFIVGTDLAYAMPTVITWDTVLAQAILPCTALACMTPLALLIYTCSGYTSKVGLMHILAGISLVATAASCILMAMQLMELGTQRNAFGTAAELVPLYPAAIALFGVCLVVANLGSLCAVRPLAAQGLAPETTDEKASAGRTGRNRCDSTAPIPSTTSQNSDTSAAHLDPTARTTPNRFSPIERKVIFKLVAMCALAYAGTFAVRFCFYCFHMTSGVV